MQTHAIAFIALFWFCFLCVKLKCYCVYNASRIIEVALRKYTNYPVGRIIALNMHIRIKIRIYADYRESNIMYCMEVFDCMRLFNVKIMVILD